MSSKENSKFKEPNMKLKEVSLKHKGKFLNTYEATYENNEGHSKVYEVISRNPEIDKDYKKLNGMASNLDAVGIICFNAEVDKVLLQKEFRMTCNDWVYNFPGGLIDAGETPEQAAKRELYEETGLNLIKVVDVLPSAYTATGITNETVKTLICLADGDIKPSDSVDEEIEADWYTREEIRELIEKNESFSLGTLRFLWAWAYSDFIKE